MILNLILGFMDMPNPIKYISNQSEHKLNVKNKNFYPQKHFFVSFFKIQTKH